MITARIFCPLYLSSWRYWRPHAPQNLTVIIERDGNYPAMHELLAQLSQAKAAVAYGRQNAKPCARAIAQKRILTSTNNIIENKELSTY